ncbi:unnamed protein product [Vitrella brassicaformis CCMP3155]|uniref:Uncharacterized protein n=1 Tax=Vitrella brassicaformis (strain CCMP3155) TaxID=1169540 RepID=A0A0G4GIU9_VITBC|nr:unnamed protein product [Vitrella brassicaformis CCMP3155]|eukprot:CEM29637.1 unnamed protein product [Vitrella brassicaformis CCMP3155]
MSCRPTGKLDKAEEKAVFDSVAAQLKDSITHHANKLSYTGDELTKVVDETVAKVSVQVVDKFSAMLTCDDTSATIKRKPLQKKPSEYAKFDFHNIMIHICVAHLGETEAHTGGWAGDEAAAGAEGGAADEANLPAAAAAAAAAAVAPGHSGVRVGPRRIRIKRVVRRRTVVRKGQVAMVRGAAAQRSGGSWRQSRRTRCSSSSRVFEQFAKVATPAFFETVQPVFVDNPTSEAEVRWRHVGADESDPFGGINFSLFKYEGDIAFRWKNAEGHRRS